MNPKKSKIDSKKACFNRGNIEENVKRCEEAVAKQTKTSRWLKTDCKKAESKLLQYKNNGTAITNILDKVKAAVFIFFRPHVISDLLSLYFSMEAAAKAHSTFRFVEVSNAQI